MFYVRDENNIIKTNSSEKMEVWRRHYKQKFDLDEKDRIQPIEVNIASRQQQGAMHQNKIDIQELEDAINDIKIAKASGEDEVDPEMIKYMGKKGIDWLHKILSKAWETNKIPQAWKKQLNNAHIQKRGQNPVR